jgi:hypothetical protein
MRIRKSSNQLQIKKCSILINASICQPGFKTGLIFKSIYFNSDPSQRLIKNDY